jgi:ribulose-5-phosphate 4-epimerase/fuculose-1-phosphate aldolase
LILVTPTKMNKGDITKDDVVFITMAGDVVEGLDDVMRERNDPMFGVPGTYESLVELFF